MIKKFIEDIQAWAIKDTKIECVILVGSYARGTQKDTSDIDLCIVTTNKKEMIKTMTFPNEFGFIKKLQMEYYGACTSIRVWYDSGLEVEFGLVDPAWISPPFDAGTLQVLKDGYKVLVDKKKFFPIDNL